MNAPELETRIRGAGRPVLFLHGTPTSPWVLSPIADALVATHRTIEVALPGYARSPALTPYDLDVVAGAVEELAVDAGARELAIVGFSGGVYRAVALALRGRLHVRCLVSLGGLAGLPQAARDGFRGFAAALRAGTDLRSVAGPQFLSAAFAAAHPEAVAEVQEWLGAIAPGALADELEVFAAAPDLAARLPDLDLPLVARVGSVDVATPPALSEEIVSRVRGAELEVVSGSGHALVIEDRNGTIASVRRALERWR